VVNVNVIDKLEHMIKMQREFNEKSFDLDFVNMSQVERVQYIRDQHQAAVVELTEVLNETEWKPWAKPSSLILGPQINRNAYIGELIDVIHFWLNMLFPVCENMTPTEIADEIFTRFTMKNRINIQRQLDDYDGRSTKCGGCGRAVDDVAVQCTRENDQGYCAQTDSDINYIAVCDEKNTPGLLITTPVKKCSHCGSAIDKFGCVPPTTEWWGYCSADIRNLPPIKLPTT
jgi:hypothetical protein